MKLSFTDCGPLPDIPNSNRNATESVMISKDMAVDLVVEHTCNEGYAPVPSGADTTFRCVVGGSWTFEDFQCLKGSFVFYLS